MCKAEDFDGDKIEHVLLEFMSFLFLFVYSSLCFVAVTNSSAKSNLEGE